MNKSLKQCVRDMLESNALDDKQLARLGQIADHMSAEPAMRSWVYPMAAAVSVLVFLLAFYLAPAFLEQSNIQQRIANEVAINHIKLKPLEIETASIADIQSYFTRLDFRPIDSSLVTDAGYELLGGRYCSLQGVVAAQLRLRLPGSQVVQTLYETEYRDDVFADMPQLETGDVPVSVFAKGIEIKIWREKGLLFALTQIPEQR